jgi:hypothetical protein
VHALKRQNWLRRLIRPVICRKASARFWRPGKRIPANASRPFGSTTKPLSRPKSLPQTTGRGSAPSSLDYAPFVHGLGVSTGSPEPRGPAGAGRAKLSTKPANRWHAPLTAWSRLIRFARRPRSVAVGPGMPMVCGVPIGVIDHQLPDWAFGGSSSVAFLLCFDIMAPHERKNIPQGECHQPLDSRCGCCHWRVNFKQAGREEVSMVQQSDLAISGGRRHRFQRPILHA